MVRCGIVTYGIYPSGEVHNRSYKTNPCYGSEIARCICERGRSRSTKEAMEQPIIQKEEQR